MEALAVQFRDESERSRKANKRADDGKSEMDRYVGDGMELIEKAGAG